MQNPQPEHPDLALVHEHGRLEIEDRSGARPIRVGADFLDGGTARRALGIGRKKHPLARAVGRNKPLPEILDGTGGLGRDAFVLACLGYRVTAYERSEVLFALLQDGVQRLLADPKGQEMVGDRLAIASGDTTARLARAPAPQVVYLDPMFPKRRKTAQVKKEMRLFQKLLGELESEAESQALLRSARAAATQRVVVKRPRHAPTLADGVSFTVFGSSVRWDVYLTPAPSSPSIGSAADG